jgi:cell wall-associated NlpC family hydrolase
MCSFIAKARGAVLSVWFVVAAAASGATAQEFILPPSSDSPPANVLPNDAKQLSKATLDCSHLVHYLYTRAGLPYSYAPSHQLYSGVRGFRHVREPRAGDLIAWRGHVGIVVDPQQHSFLSALRSGVKVSSYASRYWQRKGAPRFLRYALADANALGQWLRDDSVPGQTIFRYSGAE